MILPVWTPRRWLSTAAERWGSWCGGHLQHALHVHATPLASLSKHGIRVISRRSTHTSLLSTRPSTAAGSETERSDAVAVGTWGMEAAILTLPGLKPLFKEALPTDVIPRRCSVSGVTVLLVVICPFAAR